MALKTEFKVGIFVVITTCLLVASIAYVAFRKGAFEKDYTFILSSRSGDELTKGMPVVLSGFKIGLVSDLELNDRGLVIIKVTIPRRHAKWIRKDTIFSFYKPLIGSPKIMVSSGDLKSPTPGNDQVFEVITVNDINDAIKELTPIIKQVTKIVDHVEVVTNNLANPQGDVNKILRNATDITVNVNTLLKKVDNMAVKTGEEIYGKDGALPLVRAILRDIVAKLINLNTTLDNVNKISTDASDSTKDLKYLRRDIDTTVDSLNKLVNDLDRLVPMKKQPEIKLP